MCQSIDEHYIPLKKLHDSVELQDIVLKLWSLLNGIDLIAELCDNDNTLDYETLVKLVIHKRRYTGIKGKNLNLFYDSKDSR